VQYMIANDNRSLYTAEAASSCLQHYLTVAFGLICTDII
jgi:hypothetical protein